MKGMTLSKKGKAETVTIKELVTRYRQSNLAEGKSEKTISWYEEILRPFSNYLIETTRNCNLSNFTVDNARGYILSLRQKPKYLGHPFIPVQEVPVSSETLRCHTRVLKAFSSWLYREGYTQSNVLGNLKMPKASMKVMEPLSDEEIKRIIDSIDRKTMTGKRNHAIVVTLLDTGLRASEVAGITLGNMNLKDGYIKVMGKGSKERVVPVGKYTVTILWDYVQNVRPEPLPDYDRLFLTVGGQSITVNTVKLLFSRLARSCGIKRLHAHLCRHTFAINYLLNGGDIFSLKEILGHTTLEMVNHYLHFTNHQITSQHHKYSPMDKLQGRL